MFLIGVKCFWLGDFLGLLSDDYTLLFFNLLCEDCNLLFESLVVVCIILVVGLLGFLAVFTFSDLRFELLFWGWVT